MEFFLILAVVAVVWLNIKTYKDMQRALGRIAIKNDTEVKNNENDSSRLP